MRDAYDKAEACLIGKDYIPLDKMTKILKAKTEQNKKSIQEADEILADLEERKARGEQFEDSLLQRLNKLLTKYGIKREGRA